MGGSPIACGYVRVLSRCCAVLGIEEVVLRVEEDISLTINICGTECTRNTGDTSTGGNTWLSWLSDC